MAEVMRRLPEVEDLVAILNGGVQRSETVGEETQIQGDVQREVEGRRGTSIAAVSLCWMQVSFCAYRDFFDLLRGA